MTIYVKVIMNIITILIMKEVASMVITKNNDLEVPKTFEGN